MKAPKRMLEILERIVHGKGEEGDIEKLEELGEAIKDGALCGLGKRLPTRFFPQLNISAMNMRRISGRNAAPPDTARRF